MKNALECLKILKKILGLNKYLKKTLEVNEEKDKN